MVSDKRWTGCNSGSLTAILPFRIATKMVREPIHTLMPPGFFQLILSFSSSRTLFSEGGVNSSLHRFQFISSINGPFNGLEIVAFPQPRYSHKTFSTGSPVRDRFLAVFCPDKEDVFCRELRYLYELIQLALKSWTVF